LEGPLFFMPIGNPRWLPPQVIVLTQDHIGKIQKYILLWSYCTGWTWRKMCIYKCMLNVYNQRLSRACIVHLVIKKNQLVLCKNYVLVVILRSI
jgi:hypothetical protein